MLWAVDVGNTQTLIALHDGSDWRAMWRIETNRGRTEDELAGILRPLVDAAGLEWGAEGLMVASVVPPVEKAWSWFAEKHLGCAVKFLRTGREVGLPVDYDPVHAVGADRVANALAALAVWKPPIVVVDFGTATTLDCVDANGVYVGGAILPGVMVSLESLVGRTAKLPAVALEKPEKAIGKTTVGSLQSGVVLGYAAAIDGLVRAVSEELGGGVKVVSTGGLGTVFEGVCDTIEEHHELLTMDGLRLAWGLMNQD